MNVKTIKSAASKGWFAISRSDTNSHTEPLRNGWSVKATRIYHHRAYRVAWSPSYDLVAPDGSKPIAGYSSAGSFASYVARNWNRINDKYLNS